MNIRCFHIIPKATLLLMLAVLTSCSASYSLQKVETKPNYNKAPLKHLMVLALYPDEEVEVRVVVEKAFATRMSELGMKVDTGYQHFSSYDGLEKRVSEVAKKLEDLKVDGIILFDPIRAKDHDRDGYEDSRGVYRALGMDDADFWGAVGQLSDSADASNFVIEISLWNREIRDFAWHGLWEINAPNGYELKYAKEYSGEFAEIVSKELRGQKLVR